MCLFFYWLSIGLLQQSTPEFVVVFWVTVDEFSVDCRQSIIDHHIHPLSKHPELKVKDSSIVLRVFWIPFLLLIVRNHLESHMWNTTIGKGATELFSAEAVRFVAGWNSTRQLIECDCQILITWLQTQQSHECHHFFPFKYNQKLQVYY